MNGLPPGDEVLTSRPPFELRAHLELTGPARGAGRKYLGLLLDIISGLQNGSLPTTDVRDPCWTLQLWDGSRLLVASYQYREWPQLTALAGDWEHRLRSLDDAAIRAGAHRWPSALGG